MATDLKVWAESFRKLTDSDATIQFVGRCFTCTYLLNMELANVAYMRGGKGVCKNDRTLLRQPRWCFVSVPPVVQRGESARQMVPKT